MVKEGSVTRLGVRQQQIHTTHLKLLLLSLSSDRSIRSSRAAGNWPVIWLESTSNSCSETGYMNAGYLAFLTACQICCCHSLAWCTQLCSFCSIFLHKIPYIYHFFPLLCIQLCLLLGQLMALPAALPAVLLTAKPMALPAALPTALPAAVPAAVPVALPTVSAALPTATAYCCACSCSYCNGTCNDGCNACCSAYCCAYRCKYCKTCCFAYCRALLQSILQCLLQILLQCLLQQGHTTVPLSQQVHAAVTTKMPAGVPTAVPAAMLADFPIGTFCCAYNST